jgi:hypothetical protein
VSDKWASSCRGKRRYKSERRADAAAKKSQEVYGVPMNSYPCEFCHQFHIGNTFAANGKAARRAQQQKTLDNFEQQEENSESYGEKAESSVQAIP